jgi:hypothetical protein
MEAAQNDTAPRPPLTDSRNVTSRMFQSAIRQYGCRAPEGRGLGQDFTYDTDTDTNELNRGGIARTLRGLYNRPYESHGLESRERPYGPEEAGPIQEATQRRIQEDLNNGNGPVMTAVYWGDGGHMVAVERIENGRVYFRNPWGSTENQTGPYYDGQERTDPPARRVEDAQGGLESMSEREFQQIIHAAVVRPPE